MKRSFLLKVSILSLLLAILLGGCKLPWQKDDDSGAGVVATKVCPKCGGIGIINVPHYNYDPFTGRSTVYYTAERCPTCGGSGVVAASISLCNQDQSSHFCLRGREK